MQLKENVYQTEQSRLALAQRIAEESVVMLKNDGMLPLAGGVYAMLGRTMYQPVLGGMGSGMSFRDRQAPDLISALEAAGLMPESGIHSCYRALLKENPPEDPFSTLKKLFAENPNLVASGVIYDFFGKYNPQAEEIPIPGELLEQASAGCDTAILAIGRSTGGEECDRHLENDYELLEGEKELIRKTAAAFERIVLLVNVNGLIDMAWIRDVPQIKAVLMIGPAGERGPEALARILTGQCSPSGKLAYTIALSYGDYPTARDFSYDKSNPDSILTYSDYGLSAAENGSVGFEKSPVTVYREGLYMGYRYFDSFGKEVLYPFGFGLSYAAFALRDVRAAIHPELQEIEVCATVQNVSNRYAGKEVLQLYVSAPEGNLEQPFQRLQGFAKTAELKPGESGEVSIRVPIRNLASYEEESASWVLEAGEYLLRLGVSSRDTKVVATLFLQEKIIAEQVVNRLVLQPCNRGKIDFLSTKGKPAPDEKAGNQENCGARLVCTPDMLPMVRHEAAPGAGTAEIAGLEGTVTLRDVCQGRASMAQLTAQMSDEELMALCVGYGPGIPFGGFGGGALPSTVQNEAGEDITTNTHPTGTPGYVSPAIAKYGIPSAYYKDGPASCGKTAWPTAMTMACSFNTGLLYAFGSACAKEAEEQSVDSWLAPALNLHRNPIGGRNFEYYSEDPFLAGICGVYICRGAAETTDVTCCLKHFALNEQETYRRGSSRKSIDAVDSIVTERVAREIYLKPFEMAVRQAPIRNVMTAFNKINGVFCGGSRDLNTEILRGEWGFRGVVVTDWGDMDVVVDGADAVSAGNDVVMPGGPPVIRQIAAGYREGRVSRAEMEKAVGHLLCFVMQSGSFLND